MWEDNIKIDLRDVGYDCRDWINLAQDRDRSGLCEGGNESPGSLKAISSTLKKSPGRNSIALRLSEATVRSRALRLLSLGPFEGVIARELLMQLVCIDMTTTLAVARQIDGVGGVLTHIAETSGISCFTIANASLQTELNVYRSECAPSIMAVDIGHTPTYICLTWSQATKGNIEGGRFDPVLWIEFGVAQWLERLVRRTKDPGSIPAPERILSANTENLDRI
ncbi:hypothetical protein ANN_05374 [Periplaneta americana]|uniref:Uncharacterized protein n=1 Tax=Periplaneta americana TaxID=6978 RepID=A0ABQ8TAZ0_PERAM|nr:hypothetical protein ANN_05374 [Periplaneta americana]